MKTYTRAEIRDGTGFAPDARFIVDSPDRDTSTLRARAIAAALLAARPADYRTNHAGRVAWYDACKHVASVVCTADGITFNVFFDLCGVPD